MKTPARRPAPYLVSCRKCGATARLLLAGNGSPSAAESQTAADLLRCHGGTPAFDWGKPELCHLRCCGRAVRTEPVRGTYRPDHKCDARCLSSKSGKCECACGGKNHGAGWGAP